MECHLGARVTANYISALSIEEDSEDLELMDQMSENEEQEIEELEIQDLPPRVQALGQNSHDNQPLHSSNIYSFSSERSVRCSKFAVGIFHLCCLNEVSESESLSIDALRLISN